MKSGIRANESVSFAITRLQSAQRRQWISIIRYANELLLATGCPREQLANESSSCASDINTRATCAIECAAPCCRECRSGDRATGAKFISRQTGVGCARKDADGHWKRSTGAEDVACLFVSLHSLAQSSSHDERDLRPAHNSPIRSRHPRAGITRGERAAHFERMRRWLASNARPTSTRSPIGPS